jgi:hypothetical protein
MQEIRPHWDAPPKEGDFAKAPGAELGETKPVDIISDEELKEKLAASPAPRVTPAMLDAAIAAVNFLEYGGTTLTICVIKLRNGFTVTGESACADPANYNPEIGRKVAYYKARDKIWPLEGYLLRQHLYEQEMAPHGATGGGQ